MNRYKRNFSSISKEEQKIIENTKVAIVGLGGLGGYVLENLGRLGVVDFHIIDSDVFDVSNLNRQILATEDNIGEYKADQAYKRLLKINSNAKAKVFKARLDENSLNMLEGRDIVFDCLDSIESRFDLENLCDRLSLPLIHGAIRGYYGQAAISREGNRIFKKIYKALKSEDSSLGNLPMTCMIVASIQVNLALRFLFAKEIKEELICIDVKDMDIDKIGI